MAFLLRSVAALIALSTVLASCQPASKVQVRRRAVGTSENAGPVSGQSNLTLSFSDESFQRFKVGTTGLTYVFKYHGARLEGAISFQGNQATLNLNNLPTSTPGEVRLEVFASSALKMIGIQPDVSLNTGTNQVTLTNFVVDGIEINLGWDGKTFQGNHVWNLEGE